MTYQNILVTTENRVGIIQLNRPKALNALNSLIMSELCDALEAFDGDSDIGAIVVTGNERAFAAGADIKQMANATPADMLDMPFIGYWDRVTSIAKPIIAAVSGFALGGGCELAMACDIITASESAKFGQPEINLGIIPGAGGTQRITKALGKSLAMEVCLAGRFISAEEALNHGLVNHVYPVATYLADTLKLAQKIAAQAPIALRMAKAAVNTAFETSLADGIKHERALFYMLFSTNDQKEGMNAFINKRKPTWSGK
ncbi:MAG TPA: enoyl-CoA hydratase [Anaerolineae bacterium]|nr:enoyl-CoA hydratase [Anaerolineae bacterium]